MPMYYNRSRENCAEFCSSHKDKRDGTMKKKCNILAICTFVLAVAAFAVSYILYHYMLPGGALTPVWQSQPGKPFITAMVAALGVLFLFSSIMSLLIGWIFFAGKTGEN